MFLNQLSKPEQTLFVRLASLLTAVDKQIIDNVYKTTELTVPEKHLLSSSSFFSSDDENNQVSNIRIKVGDTITKGQTIINYYRKNSTREIYANHAGVVTRLDIKEGDNIFNGSVIGMVREAGAARGIEIIDTETALISQLVKSDDLLDTVAVDKFIRLTYDNFEELLSTLHEDIDDDEDDASEAAWRVKYAMKLSKRYISSDTENEGLNISLSDMSDVSKNIMAFELYSMSIASSINLDNKESIELRNKLLSKMIKWLNIQEPVAKKLKNSAASIYEAKDIALSIVSGTAKVFDIVEVV